RRSFRPALEGLEDRCVLTTIPVTTAMDAGSGSLRAALMAAATGDTIQFDSALAGQTVTLATALPPITVSNLTIKGLLTPSNTPNVTVSGNNQFVIINVNAGATGVTISGLTLTQGNSQENGGAVKNLGDLTLNNDVLTQSVAVTGAGAYNGAGGTLTVNN